MLKKMSLVLPTALLLAACGVTPLEELDGQSEEMESLATAESALEGEWTGCGNNPNTCGPTAHLSSYFCSEDCYGAGGCPAGTDTGLGHVCSPNAADGYWTCGLGQASCDGLWHVNAARCDAGCRTCKNGSYPDKDAYNSIQCVPNTDTFLQCRIGADSCPSGYVWVKSACDMTTMGACPLNCGPGYTNKTNVMVCCKDKYSTDCMALANQYP